METITGIVNGLIAELGQNVVFLKVVGWFLFVWLCLTAVKLIAGIIVKFTKSTKDDLIFNKIVAAMDKYIAPIVKLLPHSTLPVSGVVTVIAKIANFVIGLFEKKK